MFILKAWKSKKLNQRLASRPFLEYDLENHNIRAIELFLRIVKMKGKGRLKKKSILAIYPLTSALDGGF